MKHRVPRSQEKRLSFLTQNPTGSRNRTDGASRPNLPGLQSEEDLNFSHITFSISRPSLYQEPAQRMCPVIDIPLPSLSSKRTRTVNGRETSYQGIINLQNHCPLRGHGNTLLGSPLKGLSSGRGWFRYFLMRREKGRNVEVRSVNISAIGANGRSR